MKRTTYVAALAGLMITACAKDSGQTDDASSATGESPVAQSSVSSTCSMVSDAEMSEALGAPVTGRAPRLLWRPRSMDARQQRSGQDV